MHNGRGSDAAGMKGVEDERTYTSEKDLYKPRREALFMNQDTLRKAFKTWKKPRKKART